MKTRLTAALLALAMLLTAGPAAAVDISDSKYSESDSSNNSASPNGWPSGLTGAQALLVGQQMMGAIKRAWDRINVQVTTTGSANAYVYTPASTSYPTGYATGECFGWSANFANTGAATLNINSLGAKNLFKSTSTGPAALVGGEIQTGQFVLSCYDGTQFKIMSALASNAGAGSSLVLLSTQTASTSATLDFTTSIDSTYDEYLFVVSAIRPATNATNLWIRISEDAGANWKSGGTDYAYAMFLSNTTASANNSSAGAAQIIVASGVGNAATATASGEVRLFNPSSTATVKQIFSQLGYVDSASTLTNTTGNAAYVSDAGAITGVRFLMSAGNITSGTIRLYGIRKS